MFAMLKQMIQSGIFLDKVFLISVLAAGQVA